MIDDEPEDHRSGVGHVDKNREGASHPRRYVATSSSAIIAMASARIVALIAGRSRLAASQASLCIRFNAQNRFTAVGRDVAR